MLVDTPKMWNADTLTKKVLEFQFIFEHYQPNLAKIQTSLNFFV